MSSSSYPATFQIQFFERAASFFPRYVRFRPARTILPSVLNRVYLHSDPRSFSVLLPSLFSFFFLSFLPDRGCKRRKITIAQSALTHARARAYTSIPHTRTRAHTHIHTHTHAHTHTHTLAYTRKLLFVLRLVFDALVARDLEITFIRASTYAYNIR